MVALSKLLPFISEMRSTLKGTGSKFFPFSADLVSDGAWYARKRQKVTNMAENQSSTASLLKRDLTLENSSNRTHGQRRPSSACACA